MHIYNYLIPKPSELHMQATFKGITGTLTKNEKKAVIIRYLILLKFNGSSR